MPKQEYKILEFHGGTNNKFDPRDIADNQNAFSALSVRNPGRLVVEGDAKNLYDKTDINGATITDITSASGGFERGYGLFSFSHDYSMESTPTEVDTDFVVINDDVGIDIYDANQTSDEWQNDKFKVGSRTGAVKPEYYNVDGALRVCDSNFLVTDVGINTDLAITKNDVKIGIANSAAILAGAIIQINQEIMYVTAGGDSGAVDEITVIRGFANTKITSHLTNQDIYFVNVPKYFGHIKQDRLFECDTSNSVNTWVEAIQTPQPPNNTRKSDGVTGTLASSAGIQSLRIYDEITASTTNIPAESEKVVLEFGEGKPNIGITQVEADSNGVVTITCGDTHGLAVGEEILISNTNSAINSIRGTQIVETVDAANFKFTINIEDYDTSDVLDFVESDKISSITDWADLDATTPNTISVDVGDTDLPTSGQFYIQIKDQTGVPAFNGVYLATAIDNNTCSFVNSSHGSADSGNNTGTVQQLIGTITVVGEDAIDEGLKRKWNFGMSFTYDGPAQEVQESLLTQGYKITASTQASGASNLTNIADGSELVQDGGDPNPADSNWATLNSDGSGAAQWSSADPPVYQDGEEGSLINTLTGDAIDAGKRYSLTFTVGTATLNLAIGGGDLSGTTADETFVAATNYAAGTHTVTFQASADRTHLWFTATTASEANGTIDDVSLKNSGYGSGDTSIVVDDGDGVLAVNDVIMIGAEQMLIEGVSSNTLTVKRGYNGSTAAHFANNSQIYLVEELSQAATVDWTNFTVAPKCVIKSVYGYGTDEKSWNARINGFKIYMRDVTDGDASKEWRLFSHVNFNKGTYTIFAADDSELILEQPETSAIATLTTGTNIKIKPIDTYLSENLFTEQTIIDAQYKVAEVVGRRVYIGNIKQGGRTYPDRMLRSPVNKFDTFPETNFIDVAVGDGDKITALKSFGDRLLQYKKDKVYVINTSGESEVLESEYPNAGVVLPSQVVKTNLGIAWINPSGLWFFDGQSIENLTRNIEINKYPDHTTSIGIIGFDKYANRLIYTPNMAAALGSVWYMYDLQLKAYQRHYFGDLFPYSESGVNNYTNMVTDSDGNLVIGYVDSATPTELNFYQWNNSASDGGVGAISGQKLWQSKDIDLASPAVNKKIYKVYVTYKCSGHSGAKMTYATDGSGDFSGTFAASTNYNAESFSTNGTRTGFKNTNGAWAVAELKPSSSINNVKSIQLLIDFIFIASGTAQTGGGTSSIKLAAGASATAGIYNDYNIFLYSGQARYNSGLIENGTNGTTYSPDGSSRVATVLSTFTDKGYGNDANSTSTKYILGSLAPDFEINDITVVYRVKKIK